MTSHVSGAPARLRVCHLITGFDTGGAERVLLQSVQRLDPARFESFIVSLRPPGPLSPTVARTGVETVYLGMGRRPGPVTLWRLARLLRQARVAIVHAYLYDASIAARLAGRWAGVPVVLTSTRAPLEYLPRYAWWLDRFTARWCQRVIAVSQHTADVIVRVEKIPRDKVRVVPNGVDLRRFAPRSAREARASLGIEQDAFVVGSIGRLSAEKGQRFLLEALAIARRAIPSFVCLIAGDGPLRPQLQSQAAALGIGLMCRFLGDVREVETIFAAADVTVLPSLFEGMPNAVLEAMAMGCPVVATAVGGSVELVRPGETGLLVPPSNPQALADALVQLAASAPLRAAMRARSREVVEAHYGIDRTIASIERLYLEEWERAIAPRAAVMPPAGSVGAGSRR